MQNITAGFIENINKKLQNIKKNKLSNESITQDNIKTLKDCIFRGEIAYQNAIRAKNILIKSYVFSEETLLNELLPGFNTLNTIYNQYYKESIDLTLLEKTHIYIPNNIGIEILKQYNINNKQDIKNLINNILIVIKTINDILNDILDYLQNNNLHTNTTSRRGELPVTFKHMQQPDIYDSINKLAIITKGDINYINILLKNL